MTNYQFLRKLLKKNINNDYRCEDYLEMFTDFKKRLNVLSKHSENGTYFKTRYLDFFNREYTGKKIYEWPLEMPEWFYPYHLRFNYYIRESFELLLGDILRLCFKFYDEKTAYRYFDLFR